jgi:tyrosyl-tRNA synthetase
MIKQGAVRLDGEKIADRQLILMAGTTLVCQVGKRKFARVTLVE